MSLSKKLILKVALKFLENLKILKKFSLKNAIFKHFWGFFACLYAILRYRDNRVSPAKNSLHSQAVFFLFYQAAFAPLFPSSSNTSFST